MSEYKLSIIESITDIDINPWNNLVKQSKLGCFFHRYEWQKAIESGLQYKPKHILVEKKGNLIGIFPYNAFSTSFIESANMSTPFFASSSVRIRGGRNLTTFE